MSRRSLHPVLKPRIERSMSASPTTSFATS
jgi:hypothetical protein